MNLEIKRLIKGIIMLSAPKVLTASITPMVVGLACAFIFSGSASVINLLWFFMAVVAIVFIETGKNTVNDYFDFVSGADRFIDESHVTPFSGGRRVLTSNVLSKKEIIIIGILAFCGAGFLGLVMVIFKTPIILWVGIAGILISIFYTAPPLKFCYRGLGELSVGIVYGPLIVLGTYMLITEQFSVFPLLVSLPLGFLVANILVINEYPDYEADFLANKRNLVVIFGKQKAVHIYACLFGLSYASLLPIVIYTRNFIFLIGFLTIPLAIKAVTNCKKNYDNIPLLLASNQMTIMIYMLTGVLMIACMLITSLLFPLFF